MLTPEIADSLFSVLMDRRMFPWWPLAGVALASVLLVGVGCRIFFGDDDDDPPIEL